MMTEMETFSVLLALCEGNPPVICGFSSQRPVSWSFGVFYDLRLNKQLNKQSIHRWIETPSHSLWRHCNGSHGISSSWVFCTQFLATLTHWDRDEMKNISQMTFSNAFSSMKMFEFRLQFHWTLFPRVQLTIFQRRPGDKPLSETMMVKLLTHICVNRPQWVNDCCDPGHVNMYICSEDGL